MDTLSSILSDQTKLIVFDFDGTLVDSNPIKLKAFDICFAEFAGSYPQILEYCYSNHHTPRWVKFRTVYETILNMPYTPEIERALHKRYADATTDAVTAAPEIAGAFDFMRAAALDRDTALISSTPHEILLDILKGRRWENWFRFVQGAPMKKSDWIRDLMGSLNVNAGQTFFFGDTIEDLESANEAGCRFVGVANAALAERGVPFIKDFQQLRMAV